MNEIPLERAKSIVDASFKSKYLLHSITFNVFMFNQIGKQAALPKRLEISVCCLRSAYKILLL